MGIHGLNNVIKKENPTAYQTCNYMKFGGYTLAMDVSIFLHKYVHTDRHTWFSSMVNFFIKMKIAKIDIVAIFDGDHVPIEKFLERDSRRLNSQKLLDKIKNAEAVEDIIRINYGGGMAGGDEVSGGEDGESGSEGGDEVSGSADGGGSDEVSKGKGGGKGRSGAARLKVSRSHQEKVCAVLGIDVDDTTVDVEDPIVCIKELQKIQDKWGNQCEKVGAHHTEQMIRLVKCLGIPYLKAYGEAEALCASLAVHGYVDGVLSRDTDSLVYGAPLFVCEFKQDEMTWTTLKEVLDSLELTMKQFIDLCIMCGCDYNMNMPKIGPVTAYKKIMQYGSIEEYEKNESVDTTCLRYKRCREIFVPYSQEYLKGYKIPFKGKPDAETMKTVFEENNCKVSVSYMMGLWAPRIVFEEDETN